ncbi:MAG: hypothetical protein WCG06_00495 [Candidatus Omnitrophota bacterium]
MTTFRYIRKELTGFVVLLTLALTLSGCAAALIAGGAAGGYMLAQNVDIKPKSK